MNNYLDSLKTFFNKHKRYYDSKYIYKLGITKKSIFLLFVNRIRVFNNVILM